MYLETKRLIIRNFTAEYAFSGLRAHKIFSETIDGLKSAGLMEKLGMRQEGIQRQQVKNSSGNWADLHFYGILRKDWEMKQRFEQVDERFDKVNQRLEAMQYEMNACKLERVGKE